MATRLYPNRDWYTDWLTDTLTPKGGWAAAGSLVRSHFSPVRENNSSSTRAFQGSTSAPYRVAMILGVTPRLQAQTISGTVNPLLFAREDATGNDCAFRVHIWATVGDTDVVRAVVLNQFEDTQEFLTTLTASRFAAAQALTPTTVQDGDRLVIEVGFIQRSPASGFFGNASTVIGTNYTNGDVTGGSTTTTLNSYIEFSADLLFRPSSAPNDSCAAAQVVSVFPHSQTVDTTDSLTVNQPNMVGGCSNWGDDTYPVWWKLTGIAAGNEIRIHTQGAAYSTIVSLWTGSCAALTEVACAENPGSATPLRFTPTTGVDYYLLINRDPSDAGTGPGGLVPVAIAVIGAAPPGCTLATTIPSIPYTLTGLDTTVIDTADTSPELTCIDSQSHMQWFKYIPATSHRLYVTTQGTNYDHGVAIFTGTCPAGPWTQVAGCRFGSATVQAKISVPVTVGTTYWIVTGADVTSPGGGLLNLFLGDTTDLGFVEPGDRGAIEWEGNYNYFMCNGEPCFLQALAPGMFVGLRLYEKGSCWVGDTLMLNVVELRVVVNGVALTIPLTAYSFPAPCPPSTIYGHRSYAGTPDYYGSFRFRFRMSSRDTISGASLADGYVEVTWPGSSFGTYRWDEVMVGGGSLGGFSGIAFHPGFWTDRISIRAIDEYAGWDPFASDLVWYRDFVAIPATEAELFAEAGGLFTRYTQELECGARHTPPPLPFPVRLDAQGRPTFLTEATTVHCFGQLWRADPFPPYVPQAPDLAIVKTAVGDFAQGESGTYVITVTNAGTRPTAGLVTVDDLLPSGLTATAFSGTGWACTLAPLRCTRSDALLPGQSFPAITLTVAVSPTAPASVDNVVTVEGGGEPPGGWPSGGGNTATATTPVGPEAELCINGTLAIDDVPGWPRRRQVAPRAIGAMSTSFTEGNWSPWDVGDGPGSGAYCSRSAPLDAYGCGGGPSNTCNAGAGGNFGSLSQRVTVPVTPTTPTVPGTSPGWKSIRVQALYGIFAAESFDGELSYIFGVVDAITARSAEFAFSGGARVWYDGTMSVGMHGLGDATIYYHSAPGVFPIDGTLHGIQLVFTNLTPTGVDFVLALDNVVVVSGTHHPVGFPAGGKWGYANGGLPYEPEAGMVDVTMAHYRRKTAVANILMTNCGHFAVSNTSSLGDYTACSALPITARTCFDPPPVPAGGIPSAGQVFPPAVTPPTEPGPCVAGGFAIE